jgi:hypothetical protein
MLPVTGQRRARPGLPAVPPAPYLPRPGWIRVPGWIRCIPVPRIHPQPRSTPPFTQRVFADGLAVSRTAARRTRGRSPDRPAGGAAGQYFRRGGIRVGNRASGQMKAGAPCFWPDAGSPVAGCRRADTRCDGWVTDGCLPGQPSWQVAVPDRRGSGSEDREEERQALLEQRTA